MRVCRKVQVLRPRTSTSGGQSSGSVACVPVMVVEVVEEEVFFVSFLVMAAQEAKEVQERQLCSGYYHHMFLSVWFRWKPC